MYFDLPLEQLKKYVPPREEPEDFDTFWQQTLQETRKYPLDAKFELVDYGLSLFKTYSVSFNGYGGQPVKGWFIIPKQKAEPLPCIVEYLGYGGGRSFPTDWLLWGSAGFAHFVMDTRGQGSAWSPGDTPDPEPVETNPHFPGFMTRGILDPQTYYYRRVFTDAVRAIEAAGSNPAVDADKIAITGGSQGGGISLAAAGLVPGLLAVMPDVPFLCHYRVATEIIDTNPYNEITSYCKIHRDKVETVFKNLAYFDGINFAARSNSPSLFSVGLMDNICPPRTVFAAYNHYKGPKEIKIWSYNNHEGGGTYQNTEKIKFMKKIMTI